MITFLGQKLKFVLIFVFILIAVSFVFFDTWSGGRAGGGGIPAKIQGRNLTVPELQNAIRAERLMFTLGTGQLPPSSGEADRHFAFRAWNRLLVLDEARRAGFTVPAAKLESIIRTNPLFHKPGTEEYSPEQFARFKQLVLDPQGISPERFLEILRDQLVFESWIAALEATAVVLPAEVDTAFRSLFGKVTLHAVELPASAVAKDIPVTEEAVRAFYDKRPERFELPEQRKFDAVFLRLPPGADKMSEEERARARRALGEKAYQFTEPFYAAAEAGREPPDFAEAARAAGLKVETSPWLARQGAYPGTTGGAALLEAGFLLGPDKPVSDYIAIPEGFAILRLREVQPPTVRPYESVKAEARAAYLAHETALRLQAAGENLVLRLRQELAAGKTWAQAVAATGARSTTLPPFTAVEGPDPKLPNADLARVVASQLEPGQVSDLLPAEGRSWIFYLESRAEPDPAQREVVLPRLRQQLLQQRRLQLREEWLASRSRLPGTVAPAGLDSGALN
jgi:peptidyl-prolyl cis-trans isomerase D